MMDSENVVGIANFCDGTVDVFREKDVLSTVLLPFDICSARDITLANHWARHAGLIQAGEQLAAIDQ